MCLGHAMVVMTHLTYQKTTMLGLNSFLLSISAPYQDQARRRVIQLRDQYEGLFVSPIAEGIERGEFRKTGARFAEAPAGRTEIRRTMVRRSAHKKNQNN